jgi:hypothetical protein
MPIRQEKFPNLLTPQLTIAMARTISPERWKTYQIAAGFREELAHHLYLWNAAVGQSFHFPLQTAEVALRNVIHQAMAQLYGASWTCDPSCRAILRSDGVDSIMKAESRYVKIHAVAPSTPQVIASLSLGFWVALLNKHYNRTIWSTQMGGAFPHLKSNETIIHVRRTAKTIQDLRNRIFHQEPLIRHDLSGEYAAILRLIGWICPEMREWTRRLSSVPKVLRERPR